MLRTNRPLPHRVPHHGEGKLVTGTRRCLRRSWHFALCRRQLFFCQELVQDALSIGMLEPVEHPCLLVIGSIAQLPLELEQQLLPGFHSRRQSLSVPAHLPFLALALALVGKERANK